ncbi:nitroreductase family protein [Candidatus Dojkabacteria bacterium]|nr:nitroreductase family protein [Candidatus Dojkabacteria bacterium]
MDTLQTIHTRRSIRKYKDKMVSNEDIEKTLKAAMQAPSAGNGQPWEFIVIRDKELLNQVPEFSKYAQMAKNAPAAILVCGNPGESRYPDLWPQDCSAACQNILLAAWELGLGAVWTASYPWEDRMQGFRKLCDIPEDIIPFALIPVGYPDEEKGKDDRFDPEKVHENKW